MQLHDFILPVVHLATNVKSVHLGWEGEGRRERGGREGEWGLFYLIVPFCISVHGSILPLFSLFPQPDHVYLIEEGLDLWYDYSYTYTYCSLVPRLHLPTFRIIWEVEPEDKATYTVLHFCSIHAETSQDSLWSLLHPHLSPPHTSSHLSPPHTGCPLFTIRRPSLALCWHSSLTSLDSLGSSLTNPLPQQVKYYMYCLKRRAC